MLQVMYQVVKKHLKAPYTLMNINSTGQVITCCYNKEYVLGSYPSQSLQEIWFGKKRQKLIHAFDRNDFSLGCHLCKQELDKGHKTLCHIHNECRKLGETGYPTFIAISTAGS